MLVAVNYTGICGSDVHYWQHGSIGPYVLKKPMVLGHESAGTVVEVGAEVTSLAVGDRVALEPGSHEVRFTFDPTSETIVERVTVKTGETVTVRAQFTGATPTVKVQR